MARPRASVLDDKAEQLGASPVVSYDENARLPVSKVVSENDKFRVEDPSSDKLFAVKWGSYTIY